MERNDTEAVSPDSGDETLLVAGEFTMDESIDTSSHLFGNVSNYVKRNLTSTNTQLFSFLALLNTYIPGSYLLMTLCQKILGPPDPIHGGPPFEERMEPFTMFINTSSRGHVNIHPLFAKEALELLAESGISRSATVKKFMILLCGDQPQPYIIQFIKDLLIKREKGKKGKEKFSRLIEDIRRKEKFFITASVLKTASNKLRQNYIFPQTVSRLYYIRRGIIDYTKAEEWAKKAIERAPNNSYVADTLGQVYKNRLIRMAKQLEEILKRAKEALKAFKDVEMKADREEGPEMKDAVGTINISNTFNNRGLFGFIQVAKIAFEKLKVVPYDPLQRHRSFIRNLEMEVEAKFGFFEWYLTYSKPDETSLEPSYFWKDVALCYEHYTGKKAADSTSFPGLLHWLDHGSFTSKGRRALFEEAEATVADLEAIRKELKTTYEANVGDVKAAERYILSNIILSNKMHNSPQLTPVKEIQTVLLRFLDTDVGRRSPEFYLLVLMLFWPEEHAQVVQEEDEEEVVQQAAEDNRSEDKTWEDEDRHEEHDTKEEPVHLSLELVFAPDLQQHFTSMEKAFERDGYAKYLRGRYLVPLFFLGKGPGLSKWIHKSRLDAIVEKKVNADLANTQVGRTKKKWMRINEIWSNGEVWQFPEIQDILLPVRVEHCYPPTLTCEQEKQRVFVFAGEKKIPASADFEPASAPHPILFYLGLTIQGPVVF